MKPSYSENTELVFPSKGNEAFAWAASRLVIKFKQEDHENYRRNGNDLIYSHRLTLEEALIAEPVHIVRDSSYLVEISFRKDSLNRT